MTESSNFNTDSFRDLTFDLLSGIARDCTTFDEMNHAYMTKVHQRTDGEILKKYVRDIYEKILGENDVFSEEILHLFFFSIANRSSQSWRSIERFIS